MKKVKIEIGKRLFFLIIAIILVSGLAVLGNAFGSNRPTTMGHSIDEIEGLDEYIRGIVTEMTSEDNSCEGTSVFESSVSEKPGYVAVDLPASCNSLDGCTIIQEIYDKNGLNRRRVYSYNQEISSNKWFSSYKTTGTYINGDSVYTPIVPGFSSSTIAIYDDNSNSEKTSTQISIRDNSGSYGQTVYIC